MKYSGSVTILTIIIIIFSLFASGYGIFSDEGPGQYEITSVRGEKVNIYGNGIYKHMSLEVAPQGIAQDYVTFFIGIPLLLLSLYLYRKNLLKGKFLLAGLLGYFLVTYLFYLMMGMYNNLFLVYAALLSCSFFAFLLITLSFDFEKIHRHFTENFPYKFAGGFLIFNAISIAFLWLGIIVPPLLSGSIPRETEHYTTLVVQGLDLALLLPAAFVSGFLLIKKKTFGYVFAPIYLIFLSVLMMALTAKIIAMSISGYNVFPAIIIIPLFNVTAVLSVLLSLKNIRQEIA